MSSIAFMLIYIQLDSAPVPVAQTTNAPENYLGGFFKRDHDNSRGGSVPGKLFGHDTFLQNINGTDSEQSQSNSNGGAPEDYLGGFFKRGAQDKNDDAAEDNKAPETYLGGFF